MATRSPTPAHSFWGAFPAFVNLPQTTEVEVGDTAYAAGLFYVCTATAPGPAVTWLAVGPTTGSVTSVTASAPLASSGGAAPDISLTGTVPVANGGKALWCYYDTLNALNASPASGATSPNWTGATPPTNPQVVSTVPVP